MGDRSGSRPGGTCLDALAVERQARRGGRSSLGSGRGMIGLSAGMTTMLRAKASDKRAVDEEWSSGIL